MTFLWEISKYLLWGPKQSSVQDQGQFSGSSRCVFDYAPINVQPHKGWIDHRTVPLCTVFIKTYGKTHIQGSQHSDNWPSSTTSTRRPLMTFAEEEHRLQRSNKHHLNDFIPYWQEEICFWQSCIHTINLTLLFQQALPLAAKPSRWQHNTSRFWLTTLSGERD